MLKVMTAVIMFKIFTSGYFIVFHGKKHTFGSPPGLLREIGFQYVHIAKSDRNSKTFQNTWECQRIDCRLITPGCFLSIMTLFQKNVTKKMKQLCAGKVAVGVRHNLFIRFFFFFNDRFRARSSYGRQVNAPALPTNPSWAIIKVRLSKGSNFRWPNTNIPLNIPNERSSQSRCIRFHTSRPQNMEKA